MNLLLIDGNNLLWRYCSTMPTPEMAASGFLKAIVERDRKLPSKFDNTVMVMEAMEKDRTGVAEGDYKGDRKEVPELHVRASQIVCDVLPLIPGLGYCYTGDKEADSVLAGYALMATSRNVNCAILTSDKDLCQLVKDDAPSVSVIRPERDWMTFRSAQVKARYGVPPEKVAYYLALTGDKSDNIAGLPGWGEVGAAAAANQITCLDDLKGLQLPKRQKESIVSKWDMLLANYALINLSHVEPKEWPVPLQTTPRLLHEKARSLGMPWLLSARF